MERLDRNVSSGKVPFRERPEVFEAVGMDLTAHILVNVIDGFVNVAVF